MSSWEAYQDGCHNYDSSQPVPEVEDEVVEEEVTDEEGTDDAADNATDDSGQDTILYMFIASAVGLILLFIGTVVVLLVTGIL